MVETQNFRFIPAGAGNTAPLKICTKAIAVYPRWRGEHYFCNAQRYSRIGLSPLARGTHQRIKLISGLFRFIPAGAGNTGIDSPRSIGAAVYPRWRGEHSKHNLLLINDFLSQSQSTNFIVSHKQHIHYVKEYLIH
ncbi:hypothetical protein ECOT7509_3038 [Escherichia coli TW07509]|nr:hypothetical protein ECOT7509_3038 [Escherichia coli TW07509]